MIVFESDSFCPKKDADPEAALLAGVTHIYAGFFWSLTEWGQDAIPDSVSLSLL